MGDFVERERKKRAGHWNSPGLYFGLLLRARTSSGLEAATGHCVRLPWAKNAAAHLSVVGAERTTEALKHALPDRLTEVGSLSATTKKGPRGKGAQLRAVCG